VAGEAPVFEIYFTDRPITDYRATLIRGPGASTAHSPTS
jgi:hypothetical protein